jgi:hypothetical protein
LKRQKRRNRTHAGSEVQKEKKLKGIVHFYNSYHIGGMI